MSILDQIRMRHNLPAVGKSQQQDTGSFSPVQRINCLTLANTIELATEVIHELMRGNNGLSRTIGSQKLLKRDIADMVGARMAANVQNVIASMNNEDKQ